MGRIIRKLKTMADNTPSTIKPFRITFADLSADIEQAYKDDQFKKLLNTPPSKSLLKPHPTAKTKNEYDDNGTKRVKEEPALYLPIGTVEYFLDMIFQEWRIEVREVLHVLNSICVTVRVHYRNPTNMEWSFHDGVGAKDFQLDKGSSSSDLQNIKGAAVMMALPSAKSYAIKDACDHIGRIFGRDVNRKSTIEFNGAYSDESKLPQNNKEEDRLTKLIMKCNTKRDLAKLKNESMTQEQMNLYDTLNKTLPA